MNLPYHLSLILHTFQTFLRRRTTKDEPDDERGDEVCDPAPVPEPPLESGVPDVQDGEESYEPHCEAAREHFVRQFSAAMGNRLGDTNLTIEDIAAGMAMSRVQLYRKSKALTGLSPTALVRTLRLREARHMLSTAPFGTTVAEIGYAVGFSSPSHFVQSFRQLYGVTPNEMRKKGSPSPSLPQMGREF